MWWRCQHRRARCRVRCCRTCSRAGGWCWCWWCRRRHARGQWVFCVVLGTGIDRSAGATQHRRASELLCSCRQRGQRVSRHSRNSGGLLRTLRRIASAWRTPSVFARCSRAPKLGRHRRASEKGAREALLLHVAAGQEWALGGHGGNLVLKEDEASAQQYALKRDFMMSLRSADVKKVSSSDEMLERLRVDSDLVARPPSIPPGASTSATRTSADSSGGSSANAAAGAAPPMPPRLPRPAPRGAPQRAPASRPRRAPRRGSSAPPGVGRRGFAHARGAGGGAQRRRRCRLARPAAREFLRASRFDAPGGISEGIS